MIASRTPIMIAAICSARPCPNGCSSSAGLRETFPPINTTIEETESERVCQASATKASEPVTIPAQYLNPNSSKFAIIEIQPSRFIYFFLSKI